MGVGGVLVMAIPDMAGVVTIITRPVPVSLTVGWLPETICIFEV